MTRPRMSRYKWAKLIDHCNITNCKECIHYDFNNKICKLAYVAYVIEKEYDKHPKKYKKTLKEAYSNNK